ncbi:MAG: response regulator [Bacteriovorax sp.]|nr:response regulator [Bacteriovorax sp.]
MSTTILLVDDEKDILAALKELLEMEGYVVITALNGKTGLYLFHEFKPDLIISDMMMPIMNGYEMIAHIRLDPTLSKVPIIVMSSAITLARVEDAPWDYFIKKPYGIDDLLVIIKKLMEK